MPKKVDIPIHGDIKDLIESIRKGQAALKQLGVQSGKFEDESTKAFKKGGDAADKFGKKGKKAVNTVGKEISTTQKLTNQLKTALIGTFAAAVFIRGIKNTINLIKDFEVSMSKLSSLTGLVGDDLDFLKNKAIEFAKETTLGAKDVVDAFTLVGSAKPELLKAKEALAEVTKQTIVLAEASGMDLNLSVQALTSTLNQFELTAADSERVINALAAGSKEGAAAIPDISTAIERFGTVAKEANISVEESIGLTETLAEKNLKGAEAGTQLRNIILKLQAANIGYKDGIFDINRALTEVAAKNLNAADKTKLFGLESTVAATILLNNIPKIDKYTEAVTGTNTAYEQAAINTDNLTSKTQMLENKWGAFVLNIDSGGGVISKVLKAIVEYASDVVDAFSNLNLSTDQLRNKLAFTEAEKAVKDYADSLKENLTDEDLVKAYQWQIDALKESVKLTDESLNKELSSYEAYVNNYKKLNNIKRGITVSENLQLIDDFNSKKLLFESLKSQNEIEITMLEEKVKTVIKVDSAVKDEIDSTVKLKDEIEKIITPMQKELALRDKINGLFDDYLAMLGKTRKDLKTTTDDIIVNLEGMEEAHKKALQPPDDGGTFLESLGLDPNEIELLKSTGNEVISFFDQLYSQLISQRIEYLDQQISLKENLINESQRQIEIEQADRDKGYANDVVAEKSKLKLLKAERDKALKEKAEEQKKQQRIDTALQTSSLITATANLIKSSSAAGPLGIILAGISIAAMWGMFLSAKTKAGSVTKLAKGEVDIQGGQRGKDSIHAMLMPGESVIPVKGTRKYKPLLEAIRTDNTPLVQALLMQEFKKKESMATEKEMLHRINLDDSKLMKENNDLFKQYLGRDSYTDANGNRVVKMGIINRTIISRN